MKQRLLIVLLCLLLLPVVAHAAPVDFSLTSLDGKTTYSAADLRGRVVVLSFLANWCPTCQAEAPVLERAHQAYVGKDVVFLNAFVMSEVAGIKDFVDKYRLTIPHGRDEAMAKRFGVRGVPVTFFIDREGVVRERQVGKLGFDDLRAGIEKLL